MKRVEEKALGERVLRSVTPGQQLVKVVHEELTSMLGEKRSPLALAPIPPTVIMMVGLQGSGKTTTAGKLARRMKREMRQTRLVACDVYRPAAVDQLQTLGQQVGVPVYAEPGSTDVVGIAKRALELAKSERDRVLIVDTAGRLQIDDEMMDELRSLKQALSPHEILFVADGMIGQESVNVAKGFDDALDVYRRGAHQDGRRRPRRRRALHLRGDPQAHQVPGRGRKAGWAGGVQPRPHGRAHPAAGRRGGAGGEGPGRLRRRRGRPAREEDDGRRPLRPGRLPGRAAPVPEPGAAGEPAEADPRREQQDAEERQGRPEAVQATSRPSSCR